MRVRQYLEDETRTIRAGLRDAEAWMARVELDAALTHEVEAAEAVLMVWRRSWDEHRELCDLFAKIAARILASEMAAAGGLAGQLM